MLNCKHIKDGLCNNPDCVFYEYSTGFCNFCVMKEEIECSFYNKQEDLCGRCMPDSWSECKGKENCSNYKLCIEHYQKGINLDTNKKLKNISLVKDEDYTGDGVKLNVVLDGVGKDAEIVTNENGGKQSKAPMAMHLIDPDFFYLILEKLNEEEYTDILLAMQSIVAYMKGHITKAELVSEVIKYLEVHNVLLLISKVLQEGAERYEPNNWRLIPQEEHINHALIHLYAAYLGDTQDNHIDHALCRIMMAYATEPSKGFSYTNYIKKAS